MIPCECKRLAEVDFPIAEVSRHAADLTQRFGRDFGPVNLSQMKRFYLLWSAERMFQTPSETLEGGENRQTLSGESSLVSVASRFPLPWSAYVRLLSVKNMHGLLLGEKP